MSTNPERIEWIKDDATLMRFWKQSGLLINKYANDYRDYIDHYIARKRGTSHEEEGR